METNFSSTILSPVVSPPFSVVHFFGYKGGQGRSTVLACAARMLASYGCKVLVVDADLEAPSLDEVFGVAPSQAGSTLLGLFRGVEKPIPLGVREYPKGGSIKLIGSRLRDPQYDIDYTAFVLQACLSPMILERIAIQLREFATTANYDAILVDHRSGMAAPTLTWMRALPGPTALFARMDGQWRGSEAILKQVLSVNPQNPGFIVSFKPDSENDGDFRTRSERQKNELLEILCETLDSSSPSSENDDSEPLAPEDLEDHWIVWPYDSAFRDRCLPDIDTTNTPVQSALDHFVRLLDIHPSEKSPITYNTSGSVDQGDLIMTEMLRRLMTPQNSFNYIFGRKGTGKTRMLAELSRNDFGEALLVDAQSQLTTGLQTSSPEFKDAAIQFENHRENLWWAVFLAALKGGVRTEDLRSNLRSILDQPPKSLIDASLEIIKTFPTDDRRIFLVDGIETAFESNKIFEYVESLFRFLLTIQTDSRFSERLEIKLFLRTDLARGAVQNLEQQKEGRDLTLEWDYKHILNFALSRLKQKVFQENFPDVWKEVDQKFDRIGKGEIPIEECEGLLTKIFPKIIRRFKVAPKTFFNLHFTDALKNGTYYPRVMQSFLQAINNEFQSLGRGVIENGRIGQSVIVRAYEKAAGEYLDQVRQELRFLLDFGDKKRKEAPLDDLNDWLNSFSGLSTPFVKNDMVEQLSKKTDYEPKIVSECLERMKAIGIFEDRPDYPGQWRVGRLFKSSLKMKYNRRSLK